MKNIKDFNMNRLVMIIIRNLNILFFANKHKFCIDKHIIILVFALSTVFLSCKDKNTAEESIPVNPLLYKRNLEEANKLLVASEDIQIDDYIDRKSWKMEKSLTGLRYNIYQKGYGKKVIPNSIVRFNIKVELLNGYVCYDSEEDGIQEIRLGRSVAPSGLEEGLAMMREGDRAKLILPSHLAYGLLGKEDRIPAKAILIYDINVIKVKYIN